MSSSSQFILYQSTSWYNGNSRTIDGHGEVDPDDSSISIRAGDNRKLKINGDGTAELSGERARMQIGEPDGVNHYDVLMQVFLTLNSSIDNVSLRLRSRHNESGDEEDRFGGYGAVITNDDIEFKRENYHNDHDTFDTIDLDKKLSNDKEYHIRFYCKDNASGDEVDLWCEIDYGDGNGFVEVARSKDDDPEDYMLDRNLYISKSYAWIRTNGDDPEDLIMRDLFMIDITESIDVPDDPNTDPDGDDEPGSDDGTGTDQGGGDNSGDPDQTETVYNDMTIAWNINSDYDGCICKGQPTNNPPTQPPQTNHIYHLRHDRTGEIAGTYRMATVSGDSSYYLQVGELANDADSVFVGEDPQVIDVPLRRVGNPTGSNVSLVIRKGTDDTIAKDFGTIPIEQIESNEIKYYRWTNTSSYTMVQKDRILIEFSGGDKDNYLEIFRDEEAPDTGSKTTRRSNTQSAGTYTDVKTDIAMIVFP